MRTFGQKIGKMLVLILYIKDKYLLEMMEEMEQKRNEIYKIVYFHKNKVLGCFHQVFPDSPKNTRKL